MRAGRHETRAIKIVMRTEQERAKTAEGRQVFSRGRTDDNIG
jgi:hypothetical protein